MTTEACCAEAVDLDSDDLNVLELPEASGSDLTGSDDDSDSSEGNWVMHEPGSASKATADALPSGQKKRRKLKGADEHDRKAAAKVAKQNGKAEAINGRQDSSSAAEGSSGKKKATKKSKRLAGESSEPSASPTPQKQATKSKKAKAASEDVFAPAEDFEEMLQDDAPLQPVKGRAKAGKRQTMQKHDSKVSEHAEPDEEYEWG